MNNIFGKIWMSLLLICSSVALAADNRVLTYHELRNSFVFPDHARWGEVPLWWWEGDRMNKKRVTWQLENLAEQGVKSVCPIQRSPGRCDPQSFSPKWWDMFVFVNKECRRLGMTLWAYDQVGYGHYGWLEKAAAKAQDTGTKRIVFLTAEGNPDKPISLVLPAGQIIGARAYPVKKGLAGNEGSINLGGAAKDKKLEWVPTAGTWRVGVSVAVPYLSFQLNKVAADTFIDMFYGQIERRLGKESMGKSFVGIFQDEHPPTPRDIYTKELAETFRQRFGYDIARAIPALHFDVGALTPKYRTDFFDAYLAVDEQSYWKRVYDWTHERGLLTSYDNWGRQNIHRASDGYIDYFRTQRWFSAPGYDDAGQRPLTERNYYDTKIAASIARLYRRPRVWSEAFHSSGWGRTTDQTLSWLSANYAFGANLYDEHGLYYSTRAGTWEHAAPDPHWRQPYWRYYKTLSDWVSRMSYLMSQGTHVVDVAVHYPVVSLLAGEPKGTKGPDYNLFMKLSRTLYDVAIDNDIADDDSILAGSIKSGKLFMGGNGYRALVFGPETTVRRSILKKALQLAESGGTVIFFGRLPSATSEGGRGDPRLARLLEQILGVPYAEKTGKQTITKAFSSGGFAAFIRADFKELPVLVSSHIERDFVPTGGEVYVNHRCIGDVHVYLVQNTEKTPIDLKARYRVKGVPELWDAFTGQVQPVDRFKKDDGFVLVKQRLEGNTAYLLVFRPGDARSGGNPLTQNEPVRKELSSDWIFSVIPTRDNLWGEFRWPPSETVIGAEVRSFRYAQESSEAGEQLGWHKPEYDNRDWQVSRYSIGPYWLFLGPLPGGTELIDSVFKSQGKIDAGNKVTVGDKSLAWQTVEFSKQIGLAKPAPWGGHSGYPDGAIDQNFFNLPKGRKLLFTRIRSPKTQRLGLRVELRNSKPRLWVNGQEQPFEDALGNLPLRAGENNVLLELPDGGHGMLFVQREAPSVKSMEDAAQGIVRPDLRKASWIWAGNTSAAYVRTSFNLKAVPAEARIVVTADNGYRLFVNGVKIEEEIGPWARWQHPESINITTGLRAGENVIAAWAQNLGAEEGFVLAMKARKSDDTEFELVTDGSWKGSETEQEGWEQIGFDDSGWETAKVLGRMGTEPWGLVAVENVGIATEPRRKLAIDLPSPYLECFNEVPDIIYDIKPQGAKRIGWYRFTAPPGLRQLSLNTAAKARVWVDGVEAKVRDGIAYVAKTPLSVSTAAIRLEMEPGAYGGAAFRLPIGLSLEGGTIQTGEWSKFGLPTYSGIGVYKQKVRFTAEQLQRHVVLDLGQVLVAAEVLVNGKTVGVRLARPFKFDLTRFVKEGENALEVRVANTIAPHYTVTNQVHNLGPTASGLIGPVILELF
ncbi:MAG: hypothetical protein FVQ85_13880 [Planctomycetes bacterium]|nr:hypothetical protein [Planctomycetota bacterium]